MTRIDHAAKARQILEEIPDMATEAGTSAWCTEAQVHATLALVEQQRVANLQAYWNMLLDLEARGLGLSEKAVKVTRRLAAEIETALDLKEESI